MPFAPFIFLICLVAGIAYLIYVKRKERELIATCEGEGCGEDETDDILQAIYSALGVIFVH